MQLQKGNTRVSFMYSYVQLYTHPYAAVIHSISLFCRLKNQGKENGQNQFLVNKHLSYTYSFSFSIHVLFTKHCITIVSGYAGKLIQNINFVVINFFSCGRTSKEEKKK